MNRLVSDNLDAVTDDRLPPRERSSRVRILFISSVILGFQRYYEQLLRYAGADDEVDAVFVRLRFPLWNKVIGKSIPGLSERGWDLHSYRHLVMWRYILKHWLTGRLPADRFDVVHILTEGVGLVVVDLAGRGATKYALNIDVTAVQDYNELGFSQMARAPVVNAQRRMFRAADLIVCRNRWCAGSLDQDFGVPDSKIQVARNSMVLPPRSRMDTPQRQANELVRVVFVGNDFARKGGMELLRLHQQRFADRAELHICSSLAKPDHSAKNVVWHGAVNNNTLRNELLPSMDIFVLPTRNDMHPWAVLEAASVGLPVISSRLAGIPEMVKHGQTGLLCDVGDWSAVEQALSRLVDDAPYRQALGRNAREHIATEYNPDRQFGGLMARLKQLGNTPSPAAR